MPPDAGSLERLLGRVMRRARVAHALYGIAAGVAAAGLLHAAGLPRAAAGSGVAALAGVLLATRGRRSRRRAAVLLERAAVSSRNIIITAEELLAHPDRASAAMRARVFEDAVRLGCRVRPAAAHPIRLPTLACLVALAVAASASRLPSPGTFGQDAAGQPTAFHAGGVTFTVAIEPPAYAARPAVRLTNPDRIEVLAGSTVRLAIDGDPREWRLRFGARDVAWSAAGEATVALADSGYFALESRDGRAAPRLVPVLVVPDRAPVVRIDAPARDLMVPDARRTVDVRASASDDLGLDTLELRYTKVSGTGEDFEFVEGRLPIAVTRPDDRAWRATGRIPLESLQLEPGDSLVYRAVARDRRPGRQGESSSDTYFVEVAGPGQIALDGFDLPPDQARYALSQQMVVLRIERLRAREAAMRRDALRESALAIAAEQRAVRAYFIFLMGGHVEDEEVEAAQSSEIQEGRLENTARREISTAVHLMTRAEQGLMAPDTAAALTAARQAVDALQRAFGRNRYILRTPPSRAEIDPGRRLSGNLDAAATWRRDAPTAEPDVTLRRIEAFVSGALAVAKRIAAGEAPERAWFARLAEAALAIDPNDREWQATAARLLALEDARASDVAARLSDAVQPAIAALRLASRPAIELARPTPLTRAWPGGSR